nr:hypothetical protein [Polymorphobacter sp.]
MSPKWRGSVPALTITALALITACAPEDPTADARRLGLAFCRAIEANEEPSVEALMTPVLQAGITRLRTANPAFRKANPADRPLPGAGLRLTGQNDATADCTPMAQTPDRVTLSYAPASGGTGWKDRLELVREPGGRLLIGDIIFAPDHQQRLSTWIVQKADSSR